MGIQGLLRFIKDATREIHIREYSGRCVAVDTYCWLHRGAFACADKLAKGQETDQYVKYCMKFVDMLESYNVRPILVFDGCHLPSKKDVEKQRRERREFYMQKGKQFLKDGKVNEARDAFTKCISVTPHMALNVMKAARERGIDCIVAPYEADAQLAHLLKNGYVQAVVTEDSDLLCFGCEKVIFKMDLTGRAQEVSADRFQEVKNLQGFTKDTFRHMCILSGCDYLPSIKGVGLVKSCKALKLGKNLEVYQMVKKLHQYIKGLGPVEPEYAIGFERADKTFLYQLVIDPKSRKMVPLNPYPPDIKDDDVKFAGPRMPDQRALQIAWGNIDVNNGNRIGHFDPATWMDSHSRERKSARNRMSIWHTNFLENSHQNQTEIPKSDDLASKMPTMRGRTAVIDVTNLLESRKRKHELLNSEAAMEICTQIERTEENEKEKKRRIGPSEENELKKAYKTGSPSKLSLRQRMRRKASVDETAIVQSRFFSNTCEAPSFMEQSAGSLTQVEETPEKSTGNESHSNMLKNDCVLNEILQEMKEMNPEPSPHISRKSNLSKNSPKKIKNLLERLKEYQKRNEIRTPLIQEPAESLKELKATVLRRKKLSPLCINTQRIVTRSNHNLLTGTPKWSELKKRTVLKPPPVVDVSEDVTVEQNLSDQTFDDSTIIDVSISSAGSVNVQPHLLDSNTCNEDIPVLDAKQNESATKSLQFTFNQNEQSVKSNLANHYSIRRLDLNQSFSPSKGSPDKLILSRSNNVITISSEEEGENIPAIDRMKSNHLCFEKESCLSKTPVTVTSKYFVGAKASGLRRKKSTVKKKNSMKENQPKISCIFSKIVTTSEFQRSSMHSDGDSDFTPESGESRDLKKIKAKMVATRKLFVRTPSNACSP